MEATFWSEGRATRFHLECTRRQLGLDTLLDDIVRDGCDGLHLVRLDESPLPWPRRDPLRYRRRLCTANTAAVNSMSHS